ncbi:MAG TPA: carboxypeptidase-like regulatory domain-containing protein [Pyrinomonadaceae bacterium]
MRYYITSFLLLILVCVPALPQCKPGAPANGETTRGGSSELIAYKLRETYSALRGKVINIHGQPKGGMLVEVFDRPEWIEQGLIESPVQQKRVAVYKTKRDGKFCFEGIPPGHYELRISMDRSWNIVHLYVVIDPKDMTSTKSSINIIMSRGI